MAALGSTLATPPTSCASGRSRPSSMSALSWGMPRRAERLEVDWYNATEDPLERRTTSWRGRLLGFSRWLPRRRRPRRWRRAGGLSGGGQGQKAAPDGFRFHLATPQIRPEGAPRGSTPETWSGTAGATLAPKQGPRRRRAWSQGLWRDGSGEGVRGGGKGLLVPRAVEPEEPHILAAKEAMRLARPAGLSQPLV